MESSGNDLIDYQSESLQRSLLNFDIPKPIVSPPIAQVTLDSEDSHKILYPHDVNYFRTGQGEQSSDYCGTVSRIKQCSNHDCKEPKRVVKHHCKKHTCPVCSEFTVNRASARILERAEQQKLRWSEAGFSDMGKVKHIVLSPPQDEHGNVLLGHGESRHQWSRDEIIQAKAKPLWDELLAILKGIVPKEAIRTIESFDNGHKFQDGQFELDVGRLGDVPKDHIGIFKDGFFAGVVILHLERKKHLDGSECERGKCSAPHKWVWGPHFHFVGYGFIMNSEHFYNLTGWMYKQIVDYRQRSFFATVRYQLSHSAHFVDSMGHELGQCYRYVGAFGNRFGGKLVVSRTKELSECPSCGAPFHDYGFQLDADGRPTEEADLEYDRGPVMVTREKFVITLHWKGKTYPDWADEFKRRQKENPFIIVEDVRDELRRKIESAFRIEETAEDRLLALIDEGLSLEDISRRFPDLRPLIRDGGG